MATTFNRPDIFIEERDRIARRIEGVSTAVTGFLGIATRGPIGVPVLISGVKDFERIFGGPLIGESLYHAVDGFFKNRGKVAHLVRLGHYSDLAGGVLAAAAANVDCLGIGNASFAQFTGAVDVTTTALTPAEALTFEIDGGGAQVATIAAVPAIVTGSGGAFGAGGGGDTASYKINGGAIKTIDLSTVGAGIALYLVALNAQMEGVSVVDDGGGEVEITTDRKGSSASIELLSFGATFAASTGLAPGVTASAGPNNVSDVENVTFAEAKALLEDAVKTATPGDEILVTQNGSGQMVITATLGSPGVTSVIDLTAADAALLAAWGLGLLGTQGGGSASTGSAASAATSVKFKAGFRGDLSEGLDGNALEIIITDDPKFASSGVGNDIAVDVVALDTTIQVTSITGIVDGSILKLVDGPTTEYVRVQARQTDVVGSTVVHTVTLTAPIVNSFAAATSTLESVEHTIEIFYDGNILPVETWKSVSLNPDADHYVETMLNDTETGSIWVKAEDQMLTFSGNILQAKAKTALTGGTSEKTGFVVEDILGDKTAKNGLFSLDSVQDLSLFVVPPSITGASTIPANSVVHNAMLKYAGDRMDCFAILDNPDNLNSIASENYRLNVMGADSKWGAMYWPHGEIADPLGSGSNPTIFVPPSGHMAGIYARVDNIATPEGGVATAPAGEGKFGKVVGFVGLRYDADDVDHDRLNPIGVNVIRRYSRGGPAAPGIIVMGARTLSSDPNFVYIQVRRLLTFIGQSLRIGSRFALFRNNDFKLWGQLTDIYTAFLRNLHSIGQLRGASAEEAYFVKIDETLNDAGVIAVGQLIAQVAVAAQKPSEFIIIQLSQLQTGSSSIVEFAI